MAKKVGTRHVNLCFCIVVDSGVGDDTAFRQKVLMPLLGSEDHIDVPKIRRLYFECYTLVAA